MCNSLDVEVDSQFNSLVLNSKYVEKTLERHGCKTTDELIKVIGNWLIGCPDSSDFTYILKCRHDCFCAQGE